MPCKFEAMLVDQCAPTLAGVKPASLFRIGGLGLETICRLAAQWDRRLAAKGIRVHILKLCHTAGAAMIYVYRPDRMAELLADRDNRDFLRQMGYHDGGTAELLAQLSERFCLEQEYPHEIGLFLGYPLEDVVGFIRHRGWNYTFSGCWKVYGDPEAARKCFARYKACTALYQRMYAGGASVLRLAVAA